MRIDSAFGALQLELRCITAGVRVLLGEWSFGQAVYNVDTWDEKLYPNYIGHTHRLKYEPAIDREFCLLDRRFLEIGRLRAPAQPKFLYPRLFDLLTSPSHVDVTDSEESLRSLRKEEEQDITNYDSLACDYLRIGRFFTRSKRLLHRQEVERQRLAAIALVSGLRIARQFGLTLHHISLLNALAELNIQMLDYSGATTYLLSALNGVLKGSNNPPATPDAPIEELEVLGARHPSCGFAWGEAESQYLLGKVFLATGDIQEARSILQKCVTLREQLGDNKLAATQELLGQAHSA
jgi:hypothetical protein